jgi:hypothetical protein
LNWKGGKGKQKRDEVKKMTEGTQEALWMPTPRIQLQLGVRTQALADTHVSQAQLLELEREIEKHKQKYK